MFRNYFRIAIRRFWDKRVFSFINVIGLSIGISAALVIYLVVQYDFDFDRFEQDHDRIYRIVTEMQFAGTPFYIAGVPQPLPAAVSKEIPGIALAAGFELYNGAKVAVTNNNSPKPALFKNVSDIIFADQDYFKLLPYQWIAGSQKSLEEPLKVVLTQEKAKMYFPSTAYEDMIGRRIVYNDSILCTVSGVVKELTGNSDFIFKQFISFSTIRSSGLKAGYGDDNWQGVSSASQLFVKLAKGKSATETEAQLKAINFKYNKTVVGDTRNASVFHLQPLSDLHFNNTYGSFSDRVANKPALYMLLAVAAFLLFLGCINFISLTTAQASQRAKEIGVRKTMGSSSRQLRMQFLSETFLITSVAALISFFFTPLLIKAFGDFIPAGLHVNILHRPGLGIFLVVLIIVVSFLSGFYPAMVLSHYNPVEVLKNRLNNDRAGKKKALFRKGLTTLQFFIAQVFIMATMITVKQINYMTNKDLGFKKDAIISFNVPVNFSLPKPDRSRFVLLDRLKSIPGIQMISLTGGAPATSGWSTAVLTFKDGKKEVSTDVEQKSGDTNYIRLFHLKLLAGRNVAQGDSTKEYLINETYMHILGFQNPKDILNKQIYKVPIVGVLADFNQQSLHKAIAPLSFSGDVSLCSSFQIALRPQGENGDLWRKTIADIGETFRKVYPDADFNCEFLDETVGKFYKSEQDISRLLRWASALAIFISCLGLLGLVIFTTNSRTKEIGVRKILGASVSQIVSILSKDFIVLLLAAFAAAIPVSWWMMHTWLQNYAYKTTISWWVLLAGGLLMIIIALISISAQTIKAANANPVKSLRTE